MPWRIQENSDQCPSSKPWAVVKQSDGSLVACHESKDKAQDHLSALYANEPEARSVNQLQSLFGSLDGQWLVITNPIGYPPPTDVRGLTYLGEPSELVRRLHQYRLTKARNGAIATYIRQVLADELGIETGLLDVYLHEGVPLTLSNDGWANLVRAVIFMDTGKTVDYETHTSL